MYSIAKFFLYSIIIISDDLQTIPFFLFLTIIWVFIGRFMGSVFSILNAWESDHQISYIWQSSLISLFCNAILHSFRLMNCIYIYIYYAFITQGCVLPMSLHSLRLIKGIWPPCAPLISTMHGQALMYHIYRQYSITSCKLNQALFKSNLPWGVHKLLIVFIH